MYAEEVKGLKDKIRNMQKHEKHEEKSFKKQQEYLVILEGKYREVCEKAGVSSSLNFSTAQEINENNRRFRPKLRESSSSKDVKRAIRPSVHSTKNRRDNDSGDEQMEVLLVLVPQLTHTL